VCTISGTELRLVNQLIQLGVNDQDAIRLSAVAVSVRVPGWGAARLRGPPAIQPDITQAAPQTERAWATAATATVRPPRGYEPVDNTIVMYDAAVRVVRAVKEDSARRVQTLSSHLVRDGDAYAHRGWSVAVPRCELEGLEQSTPALGRVTAAVGSQWADARCTGAGCCGMCRTRCMTAELRCV
jgi:hypothetical protein